MFSFALREAGVDDIMEKIHVIGRDNHRSESYCWRYQNGQFIPREAADAILLIDLERKLKNSIQKAWRLEMASMLFNYMGVIC